MKSLEASLQEAPKGLPMKSLEASLQEWGWRPYRDGRNRPVLCEHFVTRYFGIDLAPARIKVYVSRTKPKRPGFKGARRIDVRIVEIKPLARNIYGTLADFLSECDVRPGNRFWFKLTIPKLGRGILKARR